MTTLLELAKKLHNTLALYNGAGYALGWKTEKVDKLLDESKRVIELADQPQQEPVAWEQFYPELGKPKLGYLPPTESTENACYTSPPAQRTWVGLTETEINNITCGMVKGWVMERLVDAVEAKLKEKNT